VVEAVLRLVESQKAPLDVTSYDVFGTSIEDIFLDLMNTDRGSEKHGVASKKSQDISGDVTTPLAPSVLRLTDGRPRSTLSQASTIFHKRVLILRRSWLSPLLALAFAAFCASSPLAILQGGPAACLIRQDPEFSIRPFPLYPGPRFQQEFTPVVLLSPPNVTSVLNIPTTRLVKYTARHNQSEPFTPNADGSLTLEDVFMNLPDNATFIKTIEEQYSELMAEGPSVNLQTHESLIVWESHWGKRPVSSIEYTLNIK
jgi:ATP-binding cassette subfamily A (ABC1) protein 3